MNLQIGLFLYIVVIFSAIIHEYAHGWMANRLGDPTAKQMGRLTLNPVAHIDVFGTFLLPLFLLLVSAGSVFIGYAKPVPFNPFNLKKIRRDTALIALAGPSANLSIAVILGLLLRFFGGMLAWGGIMNFIPWIIFINVWLCLFNLIPVPPLDGSKILMSALPQAQAIAFGKMFGPLGIFVALLVAYLVLSPLAGFIFKLILGFALL